MEPSVAGTFAGSWHEEYRSVGAVTEGSKTTTRAFNAGEEAGEALAHDTSSTDEVDLGAFMQMNHSALLGVLREEKLKENRLKTRVDELEHEMMELSTGYEAQIDGLRVAEIQMQTRVRQLSNESGFANVFSQFESQIDQLRKRCADLERRNVELETVRPAARPPTSLGSGTDSSERAQRRRLKAACNETDMLREENDALRSRERQFAVHKRVAETSAKKLGDLKSQLRERERQLLDLQLTTARLEAVVMKTQDEAKRAQQNEVVLRSERTRALEEMAVLRSHIASMESAQRRDTRIGRSLATSEKSLRVSQEGRTSWRATMSQIKTLLRSSQPALLPLLHDWNSSSIWTKATGPRQRLLTELPCRTDSSRLEFEFEFLVRLACSVRRACIRSHERDGTRHAQCTARVAAPYACRTRPRNVRPRRARRARAPPPPGRFTAPSTAACARAPGMGPEREGAAHPSRASTERPNPRRGRFSNGGKAAGLPPMARVERATPACLGEAVPVRLGSAGQKLRGAKLIVRAVCRFYREERAA